jgi:glucose-1-phosphate cytidylyltransferase
VKAIILAGGLGTRLREETEYKPKPMVEVGGQPILWHLMKILSYQGINEFIVCLGYRGDVVRDYFLNYEGRSDDVTIKLKGGSVVHESSHAEDWLVTLVDTGYESLTSKRLAMVKKYINSERVLVTYGDGLADIDLEKLLKRHIAGKRMATLTAVRPTSRFGLLALTSEGDVKSFQEKPKIDEWVNGGFFIFEPEVFERFTKDEPLERAPLEGLASDNQLSAYLHTGFWQPMDTYREFLELNDLWATGKAPWKVW